MLYSSRALRKHQNRLLRLLLLTTTCSFVVFLVVIYQKTAFTTQSDGVDAEVLSLYSPKVILLNKELKKDFYTRNRFGGQSADGDEFQQVCRIPKLDINGSEVIGFFNDPPPLNCEEQREENWAYIGSGRRFMISRKAERKHGKISCTVSYFRRIDDAELETDPPVAIESGDVIEGGDYFLAECRGLDDFTWSNLMWTIVPNVTKLDDLSKIEKPKDWSGLDVYFIGYDSLSQMSFRRKLPETVKYVEEVLKGVVLNGYNIVGDGTPQAFIPILTGSTELELPLTRKRYKNASYVDDAYPFIWRNFSDAGYITFYGEDAARVGTFTYRLKGFRKQPTDHYTRTFFQKAEEFFSNIKCFGSVPMHKEWFAYVRDFMQQYRKLAPRFLIAFNSLLSHDDINQVQLADGDTAAHLKELYETGELDNSLVIVMADHGHRFAKFRSTQQGQLEERLPFFAISLPKSFRETESGKIAYKNLLINKDRLSTPFDIHATLMDILHWPSIETLQQPNSLRNRSMSLFREIPKMRTCAAAGIEPHWCTCLNWESAMDSKEKKKISLMLAHRLVETFNNYTEEERELCALLKLDSLESAKRLVPDAGLLKYKSVKDIDGFMPDFSGSGKTVFAHYQLKFRTTPGNALYEATVQYNSFTNAITIDMTSISHVSKYGDLPHCVIDKNYFLAAFCVCRDKIQ